MPSPSPVPSSSAADAWLLGVDGGGTKTHFSLARGDGTIVASHRGPASYHVDIGLDGVAQVLRRGVDAVLADAGVKIEEVAAAYFGLPAFGEHAAADGQLAAIPATILDHDRYACGNDMVCAWAGALGGADGINIVAGTGSIGYGEHAGVAARCGGWGELFGDEGSAYWLAIRGLGLFGKMSDGRLPRGPLYAEFQDTLRLEQDFDVLDRYVDGDRSRTTIASLAPIVTRAAQAGDRHACDLAQEAAAELAGAAAALARQLHYGPDAEILVSYSGGMFVTDFFIGLFGQALERADGRMRLFAPIGSPQQGAVALARRVLEQAMPTRTTAAT